MNDDLEGRLRDALHARAERTPITGDGLQKIQARTAGRRRHARWRPTLAVGALTMLVVTTAAVAVEHDGGTQPDVVLPAGGATASPTPTATSSVAATTNPSATASATHTPLTCAEKQAGGALLACARDIPKDTGGEYLAITSPNTGGAVDRDLTVSGKARVFEAQFTVDVTQNGVVVHSAHVTASIGAPSMGVWSTVFHLAPGNYRIEAYELSAKGDGTKSATDTIWITVR
jgi:hypothetical protein